MTLLVQGWAFGSEQEIWIANCTCWPGWYGPSLVTIFWIPQLAADAVVAGMTAPASPSASTPSTDAPRRILLRARSRA
ncbi:hypothetical protein JCM11754A_30860 [Isoptericola variabilis]